MKSEYDFSRGRRGPIIHVPRGKTRITIRLDKDLIDWFRSQVEAAGGGNYQTLINSALREYVREVSSEIAEDRGKYGTKRVIEEFGPMTAAARARWVRAKRKPGRPRRGKGANRD
jgi:BrnA antitoxin of type II toxin-antitoxin system